MKAIWTGSIGFGLVNIPIKMFSAIESSDLDLDMLDESDLSNIKFKRVNEHTGKEVLWENIVKGFKIEDSYVVLTDEDFESASPKKSKIIEISEFVMEKEINSLFFEFPYYTAPEKNGEKAYVLLKEALEKTGKVGIGTFIMRSKESLCLVKPVEEVLVVQKIRFSEEIRSTDQLHLPKQVGNALEVKMAIELINQRSGPFNINKYKDSYSAELMKLIEAKFKGEKTKVSKLKVVHSSSTDLMAQLKASLAKTTLKKQTKN
jgi:DNA end-binding protein Ku